ncbi:MAG: hypothetical protein Rubg2KO_28860 [Rubricoccaceae bacterium]
MRHFFLVLLIGLAPCAASQDWQLVWADEFDTPGPPDPSKWEHELGGGGWGNQESQLYTNSQDNARVEDGMLIIEAREEQVGSNPYTSARLVTRDRASWTYGRMEARIKLPEGQGIWPAFWMMPQDSPYGGWPTSGEIDVMEYLGHETNRVHGTIHYGGGEIGHRFTGTDYTLSSGTFSDDFHTFAVEWEPREIRWYVDDVRVQKQISWTSAAGPYPAPFDQPFFLILNVAVGGEWPGYPDATTTFPQQMQVDYVRVYEDAAAYPEVTFDGPEDGSTVDAGATVELAASTVSEGVTQVEFVQDGGVLATDTEAPYTADVAGVVDGCYTLGARATNEAGFITETTPVQVTVGAGCPDGSRAPYLMVPAVIPGPVEAEYYDLGGPDVAYKDFSPTNTESGIRQLEGVDIQPSRDFGGGYDLAAVGAREWTTYTIEVAEAGTYRVQARVAGAVGGTIRLSLDGEDLLGDLSIPGTGGDITYGNALRNTVELPAGRHVLRIDFRSGGFVLNRLIFATASSTAGEEEVIDRALELRVHPSPASTWADVTYELANAGPAGIVVHDVVGREVARVASSWRAAGEHTVSLDVGALAPGVYLVTLSTPTVSRTTRLAVSR